MKPKLLALLMCILLIPALTSCQLAQPGADGSLEDDRLVGVFLTLEPLDTFAMERYISDNIAALDSGTMIDGDVSSYQDKLYAVATTKSLTSEETGEPFEIVDYQFPVDGIAFFSAFVQQEEPNNSYTTTIADPAISDAHTAIHTSDNETSVTLTGTVYIIASDIAHTYYYNPVYQSADGSIYTVSDSGFRFSTEAYSEGTAYSQTMDASSAVTQDGQAVTSSSSVTVSIHVMFKPEAIVVLQMDQENKLLSRQAYTPDTMPEQIVPELMAEYIIVEAHQRDGDEQAIVSRAVCGRHEEAIESFTPQENGILVKQTTPLLWQAAP